MLAAREARARAERSEAPTTSDLGRTRRAAEPDSAPSVSVDEAEGEAPRPARRSRWLLALAAAALIALVVVALRRPATEQPSATPVATPAAPAPRPVQVEQGAPAAAAPAAQEPPGSASSNQPPASDPLPQPAAASTAAAAPSAEPPGGGGPHRIRLESDPAGARLFWRGKEVGTTPFTLELPVGKRRAYELVLPGYVTRKVVLDGSKSDISIGLRPLPGAFTGASSRK